MSDQAPEAVANDVQDRLAAFLESEEKEPEQPPEESQQESEESTDTQESDEEQPADQPKLKLKRGEEEVEVEYSEAVELAQKGYDYTKKTQELAEQRKHTEMYAQALQAQERMLQQQAELQTAFIKEIAKVESLSDQISQYEALDWAQLSDTDPVQAQKLWISYQQLQNKRTQAQTELQQKDYQLQQQRAQHNALRLEQARSDLLKAMPDFNSDKAKVLRDTGKEYGFSEDELSSVIDPRQIRVLADAAAYRKLQAEKQVVAKKVTGKPPVVKPAAKDTKSADRSNYAEARAKLRKTGDQHIAAALIEKML